jgi:hypothetical protein
LNRYIIAKLAFEQSLRIDSSYWPSLDSFIILLYALGNYARNKIEKILICYLIIIFFINLVCLKYVFNALKLDRFYINAIILMKKIQSFKELFYSQQVELFINNN